MRRPILIKSMIILSCCMRAFLRRLEAPHWSSIWPVTLITWRSSYIMVTLFCSQFTVNSVIILQQTVMHICHITAGILVVLKALAIYVWYVRLSSCLWLVWSMFFRGCAWSSCTGSERGLETQCGASNYYRLCLLLLLKVHPFSTVYFCLRCSALKGLKPNRVGSVRWGFECAVSMVKWTLSKKCCF